MNIKIISIEFIIDEEETKVFKLYHPGLEPELRIQSVHGVEIRYKHNDGIMVILTELFENKVGTSVTNIFEDVATKIYNMFIQNVDPKKIKWIEYYQPTRAMGSPYREVLMDFDTGLRIFLNPKWKDVEGVKSYFQE